ncbi:hypothetical protein DSM112329_00223 [Paraconexibacter sp. AEG42_29]|uniref:SRPBCC family protein n=1 Tax=Paraconexibacter sp. AEG42_29 TaxID=2997339 RepID=A0AAU7AP93_9ACTN
MVSRTATSTAPPAAAWALLARPDQWQRWAPHLRGAWGLAGADGTVRDGARGAARLLGAVPVPVTITAVEPGRAWSWRVAGVVDMDHVVDAVPGGCRVTVTIAAPGPLEAALHATYGPLVEALIGRLARIAAKP